MSHRKWLAEFYRAVAQFHIVYEPPRFDPDLRARQLKTAMQQLADTTQPEWAKTSMFKALISHEEFYIARFLSNAPLQLPKAPPIDVDWDSIRYGDAKLGIDLRTEMYLRRPSASHTMSLGIANLWTKDYESAWNLFEYMNKHDRWTRDGFFGMAGSAKWCMDKTEEAVECWRAGLNCSLGDAGGASVGNRLLLFAASILRKGVFLRTDAIALLEEKVRDQRIRAWPGPLVVFCLQNGRLELDLAEAKPGIESRRAQMKFYRSLLEFDAGVLSRGELNARMEEIGDTSESQWVEQKAFTSLIWKEEFFIARHEALRSGN